MPSIFSRHTRVSNFVPLFLPLRLMFTRTKFVRLARHDFVPEILLALGILLVIHLCNKYDEFTANQYMLEDTGKVRGVCPLYPASLQGSRETVHMSEEVDWSDLPNVQIGTVMARISRLESTVNAVLGGRFSPDECKAREELAIIIPFRNREFHLKLLLKHLHPFLQRQQRAYQVFVVEQVNLRGGRLVRRSLTRAWFSDRQ